MITVNYKLDSHNILELVKKAETQGERIIIEREGEGKVAIINYADLRLLESLKLGSVMMMRFIKIYKSIELIFYCSCFIH